MSRLSSHPLPRGNLAVTCASLVALRNLEADLARPAPERTPLPALHSSATMLCAVHRS